MASSWVLEIDEQLKGIDQSREIQQWSKRSIYIVPACIKDLNSRAYKPQVVSFGPYHHGNADVSPMEEHKRRALLHFVKRSNKPLHEFVAAMTEVAGELQEAYQGLDEKWKKDPDAFLQMMILDACFMLEVIRAAIGSSSGYAVNDPIFSSHGILYNVPYIKRDMLMIENQIPLLALDKLIAAESGKSKHEYVNKLVIKFLGPPNAKVALAELGLHPLDLFRHSMLHKPPGAQEEETSDIVRSAIELYEAGIRFKQSKSTSLSDIRFKHGVLSLPVIAVDDSTEYMFLNLMAFERLHVAAGNEVTSYVFFMDNIIDSAKDVSLLNSKGIIQNAVGSDKAVAKLFNSLSNDVVLEPGSSLGKVHRLVNEYCKDDANIRRAKINKWWTNLINTYFQSPWAFLSLAAAISLLVLAVLQTVYTIITYYQDGKGAGATLPATPPRQ